MACIVLNAARKGSEGLLLPARRQHQRPILRLGKRRRARIEVLIMHLIALLDAADGDPDLEPEVLEDGDDLEASLQPPVTPDSRRPVAPMWWG